MEDQKKGKSKKTTNKDVELDTLKLQLARALADYDNLRKRVEKEQETIVKLASSVLVTKLLPIVDMLETAQSHLNDTGLAICITEIKNILREEGAEPIVIKVGDVFDESLCEAVEILTGNEETDGKIAEVVMPGWKFSDDGIIRHSKVKVFKK